MAEPDEETDEQGIAFDPAEEFAAQEDRFERLWTPHRMVYISGENKPRTSERGSECPFCRAPGQSDEHALVVRRGRLVYALLNLYPYNTSHLMVCPYRHVSDYTELTTAETAEVALLTQQAMTAVRRANGPDGFNLGMNQGEVAGAGIAAHLHQHVVPRFQGDANFLPIVGQTKALPILLDDTRRQVATAWVDLFGEAEGAESPR